MYILFRTSGMPQFKYFIQMNWPILKLGKVSTPDKASAELFLNLMNDVFSEPDDTQTNETE